jgi:hypothetical protein
MKLSAVTRQAAINSRVGGIQFIRAADPFDVWIALDCVTHRERIVARYAETVGDPFISKSLNDIVNYAGRYGLRISNLRYPFQKGVINLTIVRRTSA